MENINSEFHEDFTDKDFIWTFDAENLCFVCFLKEMEKTLIGEDND